MEEMNEKKGKTSGQVWGLFAEAPNKHCIDLLILIIVITFL